MKLAEEYCAVGVANEEGSRPCVVLVFSTGTRVQMPECMARKLADDLLRNANYLWPVEEEKPNENK